MSGRSLLFVIAGAAALLAAPGVQAADLVAHMQTATPTGPGADVGTVTFAPGADGAHVMAALHGLPPGPHGFHVHANGSCAPSEVNGQAVPAGAAGGHFDPEHTGKHAGPFKDGHLGDLPVLTAGGDGKADETLVAPRITDVQVLKGHALMIHVGGDNYADEPLPLGGGGARFACGIIE